MSTAITAGAAVGNAVAGILLDLAGARTALGVAATAVVTAAAVCLLAQRTWAARQSDPVPVH